MAERAYQFERDDATFFITPDNWQYDRAGLLAGERLLLQLEQMEKTYLEQNTRDFEITQSFSMALISPSSLIDLREKGSCTFTIPEMAFSLFYPGQYKRLIKSVRITIPSVTGPYTNISATLTLKNSWIRKQDNLNLNPLTDENALSVAKDTSISTSSAQNDAGMFELNFRDERYLPFEGAGAISMWNLNLPDKLRSFDYDTISDVIIHISYTANYQEIFGKDVEKKIVTYLSDVAVESGLWRLISFKHEFHDVLRRLLDQKGDMRVVEFEVTQQHFPYFLQGSSLSIVENTAKVYMKPQGGQTVSSEDYTVEISLLDLNGTSKSDGATSGWNEFSERSGLRGPLMESDISLSGDPVLKWRMTLSGAGLDPTMVDDIQILFRYNLVKK
jgi:hypothetical protein